MQSELPTMTSTSFLDRIAQAKPVAWWTLILWVLFVLSVIPGHMARGGLDYLVVSWWIAAGAGVAAGVIAIRGGRVWAAWALVAAVVLVVSSGAYWSILFDRLIPHDERNAVTTVLQRVWLMASGGLQTGARSGMTPWVLATVYREMVMPIVQLLALVIAGCLWVAMRPRAEQRT